MDERSNSSVTELAERVLLITRVLHYCMRSRNSFYQRILQMSSY